MKFKDNREVKNNKIEVGDLIICDLNNYVVIHDTLLSGEYKYHLVNTSSMEIEDSFNKLESAYDVVADIEDVFEVIPHDRLRIIAE